MQLNYGLYLVSVLRMKPLGIDNMKYNVLIHNVFREPEIQLLVLISNK